MRTMLQQRKKEKERNVVGERELEGEIENQSTKVVIDISTHLCMCIWIQPC